MHAYVQAYDTTCVQGLIGQDNAHVLLRACRTRTATPVLHTNAPPPLLASRMHTPAHPRFRTSTHQHTHTME